MDRMCRNLCKWTNYLNTIEQSQKFFHKKDFKNKNDTKKMTQKTTQIHAYLRPDLEKIND
jgi:hypothetical protein